MVSTNDLILTGGLLLGVLYLKKRSDQVSTVAPSYDFEQVQAVGLERLSQFGSRIEQLKDIRSQILEYEKGQAQEQIEFLNTQIAQAQAAGSEYQRLNIQQGGSFGLTSGIKDVINSFGGNIQSAINYFSSIGKPEAAGLILKDLQEQSYTQKIMQVQEFITAAEQQQAEIKAKYTELKQIV